MILDRGLESEIGQTVLEVIEEQGYPAGEAIAGLVTAIRALSYASPWYVAGHLAVLNEAADLLYEVEDAPDGD